MSSSTSSARRGLMLCAGLFVLAASTIGADLGATPFQSDTTETTRPGLLVEFSRQMAALRAATKGVSVRIGHAKGSCRGLYLGKGLVATPHVDSLERGSDAVLSSTKGLFRLRALGSVGRSAQSKPLVTFFKLRDPFHEFEPPDGRHAERGWRERLGDMVTLRGRSRTPAFCFVRSSFGMRQNGRWSMEATGPKDDAYMHMLDVEHVDPGAVVFNVKGRVVGIVVEMERPRRRRGRRGSSSSAKSGDTKRGRPSKPAPKETPKGKVAEKKPATAGDGKSVKTPEGKRSEASSRKTCVVIDVHWLLARGEHELENRLPAPTSPSIGVHIDELSGPRAESGKYYVTRVMMATPAHRAGARRGDRWLAINGVELESFQQIKNAIRARAEFEVTYRREGVVGRYRVRPR